jgi:hypothetical protein
MLHWLHLRIQAGHRQSPNLSNPSTSSHDRANFFTHMSRCWTIAINMLSPKKSFTQRSSSPSHTHALPSSKTILRWRVTLTVLKLVLKDFECVAEVESQAYARDLEGDLFESGETIREQALAQPLWLDGGQRRVYRMKGFLSGEGARGALKIYAGKKGLMVQLPFIEQGI